MTSAKKNLLTLTLACAFAAAQTGCGSQGGGERYSAAGDSKSSADSADATAAAGLSVLGDVITPPRAYYEALLGFTLQQIDDDSFNLAATGQDPVLFLNFDGATVGRGYAWSQSFLVCSQTAVIPAQTFTQEERAMIVATVQSAYTDAGRSLDVVTDRPTRGAYTTIHVANAKTDLGCVGGKTFGLAPFDKQNANPNDVAFVFSQGVAADDLAAAVIHSYGLTLGLRNMEAGPRVVAHLDLSDAQSGATSIAGIPVLPGALSGLPGLAQIGAIAMLLQNIDPNQVVDVTKLLPLLLQVLPGLAQQSNLPGLDKVITILGLATKAAQQQQQQGQMQVPAPAPAPTSASAPTSAPAPAPQQSQGQPCSKAHASKCSQSPTPAPAGQGVSIDPLLAAAILNAQSTQILLNIATLVALGGYADVGTALLALQSAINLATAILPSVLGKLPLPAPASSTPASAPAPAPAPAPSTPVAGQAQLPDLSQLLGLGKSIGDYASLITNLIATAQLINSNFSGADRDALISMLKVAYGQFFQQLSAAQAGAPASLDMAATP